MRLGVVILDVRELGGLTERRHLPVQIPEPGVDARVPAPDVPQVDLEVLHVHDVEAHDGGVQTHVGLGDRLAEVERARV